MEYDTLDEILLNTQEQCQMIDQLIKNQIQVKDTLIDKLHGELDYYKKDSAERFVEEVMKSVIKVRSNMYRRMCNKNWGDMTAEELKREYTYIFEDLTDLLEQKNIDSYVTDAGERFDPAIHKAKLEPTSDLNLDRVVKKSMSEGYIRDGRILISERVLVYQYKAESKGE